MTPIEITAGGIPMRSPLTLRKMETDTFKARVSGGNVSHAHVNRGVSAPEPQSVRLERYPTVPNFPDDVALQRA